MKKVILNIGILFATLFALIFIFCFFNGSFEIYPTEEQVEKMKIVSFVMVFVSLAIDCVLIKIRIKQ